jgi:methionyl aminopeptidase
MSKLLRGVKPITTDIPISDIYPNEDDIIGSLELAGSIHKEVRRQLQPYLKPGIKLVDIAKIIEIKTMEISNKEKSIYGGIGFPALLSLNECAAHFHPKSTQDNMVLKESDVLKIDFGTEVNGWIIDSAHTISFDSKYDPLLEAVKEATYNGVKTARIDANICDWGIANKEIMESYEITLNGTTMPIKAITNLGGHNIKQGIIHGGMFLPCADIRNRMGENYRFTEGVYAIETFGSTGSHTVKEDGENTLYRINPNFNEPIPIYCKRVADVVKSNFKTLPFTDRYIEIFNINNWKSQLNTLIKNGTLHGYPPLTIENGGYTAQYEHTVHIGMDKTTVFSNGEDY